MKITKIEIFDINCPKRPTWHPVFVRIFTDEGIHGTGEAGLAYDWGHSAAANMIKEIAKAILIGFDPFQTELLWSRMFRESFWGLGGGPVVFAAMSAIDTALWDIKAKALNVPLYQLLGGKTNDNLRTYASQLQFDWDNQATRLTQAKDYGLAAEKALAQGYDAVKVNPFFCDTNGKTLFDLTKLFNHDLLQMVIDRMQSIRDAVGSKVDILLECHSLLGATSAIQIAKEVGERFGCMFMEEPVNYLNPELHKKISEKVSIPLAAGERLYLRHGVQPYLEDQTVDILQPDIGLCGGITEAKKICDYAHLYDVQIQAHVCGGPVATAASLHLEASISNFIIHEQHTYATKDWNRELCIQDYQPINGKMSIPNIPGIGIELNDEIVYKSNVVEVN